MEMGLFLQKHGKCYQVQKCKGDGLFLAPHPPPLVKGDGLFLKRGSDITDGAGLLMGKNSPFKNRFPYREGYYNYLFRRDVYKNKILCLSSLSLVLTFERVWLMYLVTV